MGGEVHNSRGVSQLVSDHRIKRGERVGEEAGSFGSGL